MSRALPNARGPGPPPRAYRDAGTPHGSAAIRFVDYMLGLAALLILHCRLIGSNPFHPSRRPLAVIFPLFLRRVQLPIPLGLNLLPLSIWMWNAKEFCWVILGQH